MSRFRKFTAVAAALGISVTGALSAVPAMAGSATPAPASHAPAAKGSAPDELRVMMLNLYLGSSLNGALGAADKGLIEFLNAAADVYETAQRTDFPKRAKWIAATIKKENPDVLALNELSEWVFKGPAGADQPSYNFLKILRKELRAQGMRYRVASVSQNADLGLNADVGIPYLNPAVPGCERLDIAAGCSVRLRDRDAVLYNVRARNLELTEGSAKSGNFTAQETFDVAGQTLSFNRGWASAAFTFEGKQVTVLTSHLEVESQDGRTGRYGPRNWPSRIQTAQAKELLRIARGLAKETKRRIVVTGDFNTDANGYYSPAYRNLTKKYLQDAWFQAGGKKGPAVGATCCQSGNLDKNRRLSGSDLPTRIDLILVRRAEASWAKVLGGKRMSDTQPKWQSDHNFIAAHLALR